MIMQRRVAVGAARRRGAVLGRCPAAVVLVAGVSLASVAIAPAFPGQAVAAPRPSDMELGRGPGLGLPLRVLDGTLRRSSVDALINSSGQRKLGGGCGGPAGVPSGSRVYCWDHQDATTGVWVPQGVTSVSDALRGERLSGGGRPILVSWHDQGSTRVTFVNPDRHTYRHVLLVEPAVEDGRVTYRDIDVHAGGIAWYGDELYVADTRHGLRVFDLRQIFDLARSAAGSTEHDGMVGLHGGKYYGHGFRYVMAQTGSWRYTGGSAGPKCRGTGPMRTSWLSLDRTASRPVLIAGEYCRPSAPQGRVVTWPLGGLTGDGDRVRPDWAGTLPADKIQGALRTHGQWWFTQNRGGERGLLLSTRRDGSGWARLTRRTISHGPEALTCYRGQHRIWTVAEHANKRALWGLTAPACH